MKLKFFALVAMTASAGLMSLSAAHAAEPPYPQKPITVLVAFAPGGLTDTLARRLARDMQTELKQTVVVETKAGASGQIASAQVARSAPDGYNPARHGHPSRHQSGGEPQAALRHRKDFTPIAELGSTPNILLVHPSLRCAICRTISPTPGSSRAAWPMPPRASQVRRTCPGDAGADDEGAAASRGLQGRVARRERPDGRTGTLSFRGPAIHDAFHQGRPDARHRRVQPAAQPERAGHPHPSPSRASPDSREPASSVSTGPPGSHPTRSKPSARLRSRA